MTMLNEAELIIPDWPAPANVKALQTTRAGGISVAPYNFLNLGTHVGDQPLHVAHNRQQLARFVPTEPVWLQQVHGVGVIDAVKANCDPQADAAFATATHVVCTFMTADCLPVLLCDKAGSVVAAVHAGWRGLLNGVLEATVNSMRVPGRDLMAWLGPAIGPQAFEVGSDVRDVFIAYDKQSEKAFVAQVEGKWLADIYQLATQRLQQCEIASIHGGGFCTFNDEARFFSYRRDGATGRMAAMIWLDR